MAKVKVYNTKLGGFRNIFSNGASINFSPNEKEVFISFFVEKLKFDEDEEYDIESEDTEESMEVQDPELDEIKIEREFETNIVMDVDDFIEFANQLSEIKLEIEKNLIVEKNE